MPNTAMPLKPSQLPDFIAALEQQGYHSFRQVGNTLCCLCRMNFTHALIVGIDVIKYRYRYCYEFESDAAAALASWNGEGHPTGPWIKRNGAGIDELNPDVDPPEARPLARALKDRVRPGDTANETGRKAAGVGLR